MTPLDVLAYSRTGLIIATPSKKITMAIKLPCFFGGKQRNKTPEKENEGNATHMAR